MAQIDAFFNLMCEQNASDLHLSSGSQPMLRIRGALKKIRHPAIGNDDLKKLIYEIAPEEKIKVFEETGDVDFGYEIPGKARYRANFFQQVGGVSAVFREIPEEIKSIDDLNLPQVLKKFAMDKSGLILVTGPTGSGKSTTLAAIIDEANQRREDHIITIEDPLEFRHKNKNCLISHREIGSHTQSFASALRAALREDPDIILVGEMRDLETISLALEASNTGHLVLATLHTSSAAKTIDRIVDVFSSVQQDQIRSSLADGLRAVVSQRLFSRQDKPGLIPVFEILRATPAVRNHVRERHVHQIPSAIQTGKNYGMQSMDDELYRLVNQAVIDPHDAYYACTDKKRFKPYLPDSMDDMTDV